MYTVKEIAALANVTVKTLHHYHKLGLLLPERVNEAGYRLYGRKELERLQQILFFRELDFPLKDIAAAMDTGANRDEVLRKQRRLLLARFHRLERLIRTLDESIAHETKGEMMNEKSMFAGLNKSEWEEALSDQNEYLKEKYDVDLLAEQPVDADRMNEMAQEAIRFNETLAQALRDHTAPDDSSVQALLRSHLTFLNTHGLSFTPGNLRDQARFFIGDTFHRGVMEGMQVGLAYYYLAVTTAFAGA